VKKRAKQRRLFGITVCAAMVLEIWFQTVAVAIASDKKTTSGMVLDLGRLNDNVKVTAEYSNAIVQMVLPQFSEVEKRLNLPGKHEIIPSDVLQFHVLPFRNVSSSVRLKDGKVFSYAFGFVDAYTSPQSPTYSRPHPDNPVTLSQKLMTQDEAVQVARDAISKLGISLADVFADEQPIVTTYKKPFANSVARFRVQWMEPHGQQAADIIVNPATKEIERFYFSPLTNLRRPPPNLEVVAPNDDSHDLFSLQIPPQEINPEYARKLIPIMFKAVDDYVEELNLPIALPLTTNNVARIKIHNNGDWPHSEIWLTNGWKFIYRHTMVNGYYSPDVFNSTDYHPFHLQDFEGKWNLNEEQAIGLVTQQLAKLHYSSNNIHMDFAPNVIFAAGHFKEIIPRYFFEWDVWNAAHDDLQSKVEAEVNADTGELESLYHDDKAYWNNRPPIDVPISIK